jgi:hypothetical protein
MSNSDFVCWRDGIPVTGARKGWRHALGGKTGAIPRHRKHKPVPMLRTEFDYCFAIDTPGDAAREIAERMKAKDREING